MSSLNQYVPTLQATYTIKYFTAIIIWRVVMSWSVCPFHLLPVKEESSKVDSTLMIFSLPCPSNIRLRWL